MNSSELLLHPVRLRIVHAVIDGEPFTTSDLCVRLPDVSQATIYRQVALLAAGGLVELDREDRVRGAVESQLAHAKGVFLFVAFDAIDDDKGGAGTLGKISDAAAVGAEGRSVTQDRGEVDGRGLRGG